MSRDNEATACLEAVMSRKERELRDRFAMAALTGLLAGRQPHGTETRKDWSELAYRYADAMMEARK